MRCLGGAECAGWAAIGGLGWARGWADGWRWAAVRDADGTLFQALAANRRGFQMGNSGSMRARCQHHGCADGRLAALQRLWWRV